jgi:hypothetical protein
MVALPATYRQEEEVTFLGLYHDGMLDQADVAETQ